jgi:hypothetical protein
MTDETLEAECFGGKFKVRNLHYNSTGVWGIKKLFGVQSYRTLVRIEGEKLCKSVEF